MEHSGRELSSLAFKLFSYLVKIIFVDKYCCCHCFVYRVEIVIALDCLHTGAGGQTMIDINPICGVPTLCSLHSALIYNFEK